jgi:DNA polymerase III epsilon subunit-like protein
MTVPLPLSMSKQRGFSPGKGDRIIELAIARVDRNGRIEDEYATLLNPEGRDTGAVFVHGISNEAVRNAPLFSDVLADVLSRLDGAVIVAHNAVFYSANTFRKEQIWASIPTTHLARVAAELNQRPREI